MHASLARLFPGRLATLALLFLAALSLATQSLGAQSLGVGAFLGAGAPALSPLDQNLIGNPGFERGGKKEASFWDRQIPLQVATSQPKFSFSDFEPKDGKRSASVRADYRGGFTCYSQTLRIPPKAKSIHFEGQVRLDRVTYEGAAKLAVVFRGPDLPGRQVRIESRRLYGVADWTLLAIDASIPDGTKSIVVQCGVEGPCVASFDGMVATASNDNSVQAVFGSVLSDYLVRLPANSIEEMKAPFIRIPLPLLDATQRPVAIRVNTRPADQVVSLGIFRNGANRMLEVTLSPMFPGDEIKIRLDTLVMIEATERPAPGLVRLPRPQQVKGDIATFLLPAPGIDPEHIKVLMALRDIKGNDLPTRLNAVQAFVKSKLKARSPDAGGAGNADASELGPDESSAGCLESGVASSLGFANTWASVLRASGLPARLMVGTAYEGAGDEYYFVDVWTVSLGWTRIDPMTGEWPVKPATAVIHRQVDPGDDRPDGHTPYDPKVATSGLVFEGRPDRLNRARLYRYAAPVTLMEPGLAEVQRRVEASYQDIASDPLPGSVWQPIAGTTTDEKDIHGAATSHLEVQRWLDMPRLVGQ